MEFIPLGLCSSEISRKMLVPLCNCNSHFCSIPSQTLINFSFPNTSGHPNFPIQSLRRRLSVSAEAAEEDRQTETLPQSAIQRIAEKLRSLGYVEEKSNDRPDETIIPGPNSPGEIFVPLPRRLPKYRVGHTLDTSWSTPENSVLEEEEERIRKCGEGKRNIAPSLAELTLREGELRRLRSIGIPLKKKLKVGKAGITEGILNGIHERWRRTELVKITCEDIWKLNMKRTHELLEKKTGGLVIWRSGSNIILYRGTNYKYPYFLTKKSSNSSSSEESPDSDKDQRISSPVTNSVESPDTQRSHPPLIQGVGLPNRVRFQLPGEAQLAEEADALLEGLGPRFTDWWGYAPLPVDADLLPAVIPGYKRPFRLLPYGVKPKLTNDEMTVLRRLGKPLPCHFALGRNRKLQGLAAAIVKLWEKCEIVKIAVKRGVENINSEVMAEELKWLTGGSLLSRDKEFIVFYRGKDFLPAAVSSAIEERRKHGMDISKTWTGNLSILNEKENMYETEYIAVETECNEGNDQNFEVGFERRNTKLSRAIAKRQKAEKLLAELEKEESPQTSETDKESITEEERYMLRKVGLRMKAFLLLGRRGVFDGTVENMHLHWKYRELVKVCVGRRSIDEVNGIARILEAESGGILIAVEPVSKGYEIIIYRGKNYKRPASLRPRTLLSKREAMKRSLEAQRRESLKLHVLELTKSIDELKLGMAKEEDKGDMQLKEDSKIEFVEREANVNYNNNDKISDEDPESDSQAQSVDPANEEGGESHGTDANSEDPEDTKNPSNGSVQIIQQDKSSRSVVKTKYLFETTETKPQPRSPKKTGDFSKKNGQSRNIEPSNGLRNADLEPSVRKPFRALQLSNKERLLLRKMALNMKNPPVLAVGKSNAVTGVAKAIKAHFQKHPLAIVSIKGRAKGTSIQDVIYNLEHATGSVLVSQEPTKVILYRGWGSELDQKDSNSNSVSQEVKTRPIISPELISAIKLECGLKSVREEHNLASESTADGATEWR